ncbi:MAG: amidohydrolase [Rhodospirillaceae bacterium]|nr:MAG: amidohydrolase [Rhodospirillaceae bacterium]
MASPKQSAEPIIEPDLPIIDPHHHLWDRPLAAFPTAQDSDRSFISIMRNKAHYLLDDFLADINTGHNIRGTVYVEANAMYRAGGPEHKKSVGEVEFANGVAAMSASGAYGDARICAGIVGHGHLGLGDGAEDVLRAHILAGNGRFRGIRAHTAYDPDPGIFSGMQGLPPHILLDKTFRAGFKWLHKLGLSFDVWVLEPQLPDLIDLARAFPETQIILNHTGGPLGMSSYAGKRDERFPMWRENIRALAACDNVTVKLGGLGMPVSGFASFMSEPPATSAQLAAEWKPYMETCIETFGAGRCMFESNFPVDSGACTYPVLWNAFKRLAAGASKDEKTALFSGTAKRVYRLDI